MDCPAAGGYILLWGGSIYILPVQGGISEEAHVRVYLVKGYSSLQADTYHIAPGSI